MEDESHKHEETSAGYKPSHPFEDRQVGCESQASQPLNNAADQSAINNNSSEDDKTSELLMSRKEIEEALEQILSEIKCKREHDVKILSDVKKEIMAQAARACSMLDQYMTHMHQARSKELDKQVSGLMVSLGKSHKLELELEQSRLSLSHLCKDL